MQSVSLYSKGTVNLCDLWVALYAYIGELSVILKLQPSRYFNLFDKILLQNVILT